MSSPFEHPSSQVLQFLSSLHFFPHSSVLFSSFRISTPIAVRALSCFLFLSLSRSLLPFSLWSTHISIRSVLHSPLSRVFPNSVLNLNHDSPLPHCVRYFQVKLHDRAVTINCLIIIRKDPRIVRVESVMHRSSHYEKSRATLDGR